MCKFCNPYYVLFRRLMQSVAHVVMLRSQQKKSSTWEAADQYALSGPLERTKDSRITSDCFY